MESSQPLFTHLYNQEKVKTSFLIELDDRKDLEVLRALIEPLLPPSIILLNTGNDIVNHEWLKVEEIDMVTKAFRFDFSDRDDAKITEGFNLVI
mmetsp:Transcript_30797/g.22900  ORF Transcript_30797/g.22900 Transcript_30797/m.22900 type:complete len:94 (+) Transcript_30797:410-691(+)